jgi:MarR family 2-MHQ and catechol resistance regulon transcriptional repressor
MLRNNDHSISRELDLERPVEDFRHEVVLNIVRTSSLMSSAGADIFRRHGLTEAQFNALFALKYKQRPWTQSDLGRRLVVTRASVSSVLDKLEEKGYVTREHVPDNRRIRQVALTDEGRRVIDDAESEYRGEIHRVLAVLPEKDCRQLSRGLEGVRAALKNSTSGLREDR